MNWPTRKLGEICEINPIKSEIRDISNDSLVSFVPMSAVSEITQKIEKQEDRRLGEVKKGYTYFRKGDILFAKITPCMENGKVALADNIENKIGFASTEFHVIRAGEKILPEYVFYLVASKKFREEAQTKMTGSAGQKRVPKSFLENYKIPLPPLPEQKKIVAKLERVLGKISEAKKLRIAAQEAAQNLLPAELHKIFTPPHYTHPYKLENVGMSSADRNGWQEKELQEIVEQKTVRNTKQNLPFVGMEDVEGETGKFLGSLKPRAVRSTTFYFNKESVLYGKLRPYLNKVLLPNFEGHCSTEFIPLKPKKEVAREWIAYWLKSPQVVEGAMSTNTGSRMPRANMKDLMKFKIPLPPSTSPRRVNFSTRSV